MKRPLFSILTCTVGKPDLIKESIRSILNQTVSDWEIIVTDTSGMDAIKNIVHEFNDSRVKFYPTPENDPSLGWDFAHSKSNGQYVLWYDDDNCLIPQALARFKKIIEEDGPDIVSGNHAYFLGPGNRHYPHHQNTLIFLPPYKLQKIYHDPKKVLHSIFNFEFGSPAMPARWHSAATFVSRDVCEKIKKHTGSVITPRLLGNFHIHPLIFAFAQKAIYDDRPLCVIGKFSTSITQQWSNVYVKQKTASVLPYRFTGVTAKTLGNTTSECYLQAKQSLPQQLGAYKLNFEKFYDRYINELILIDLPLPRHLYHWKELWQAKKDIRIPIGAVKSVGIHILRNLKLWNYARRIRHKVKSKDNKRVILNLEPLGVNSISVCAEKLDEIMLQECGIDIKSNF